MGTSYALGKREQIAWVEEDGGYATLTANTMAANGEIVGYNSTITPSLSQNLQEIDQNGTDSLNIHAIEKGAKSVNFTMEFTPYNFKFLKYCATPDVTNTDMTTYYEHLFTENVNCKTFTLEWARRQDTNQVITMSGCIIKSLKINFSKGTGARDSFLTVTAECSAKDYTLGTAVTTVAAPTKEAFKYYMSNFQYEGVEYAEVNSGSIDINTNINDDDSFYANSSLSRLKGEPIFVKNTYTADMNVNQKDNTFFTNFDGDALTGATEIFFIRGTNDFAQFTFNTAYMETAIGGTNLDGVSTADLVMKMLNMTIRVEDDDNTY